MLWLMAHMWVLLGASFVIGLAIGWWIWGTKAEPLDETPMGTLDSDFAPESEQPQSTNHP